MKRVAIVELKSKLSHFLKLVKNGKEMLVTEHGEPIARIIPFKSIQGANESRVTSLLRNGIVREPSGKISDSLLKESGIADKKNGVLGLLLSDREESF